jgi:hypothetical protein
MIEAALWIATVEEPEALGQMWVAFARMLEGRGLVVHSVDHTRTEGGVSR